MSNLSHLQSSFEYSIREKEKKLDKDFGTLLTRYNQYPHLIIPDRAI
jgi:hypothetical protein